MYIGSIKDFERFFAKFGQNIFARKYVIENGHSINTSFFLSNLIIQNSKAYKTSKQLSEILLLRIYIEGIFSLVCRGRGTTYNVHRSTYSAMCTITSTSLCSL